MPICSDLTTDGARFSIENHVELSHEVLGIDDDDDDGEVESIDLPAAPNFDEFRATAEKIADHAIYKRVKKEGYGTEVLGEQNARVVYHYHAFLKDGLTPFDSTYNRKCPDVLESSLNANVLPGVLYALQTMRGGEHAEFLIDYSLMYRKMGCPPRVPEEADIFVVLELIRFNETGDASALKNVNEVDRKKFAVVIVRANEVYKKAVDSFKNGRYAYANNEFDIAIKALEFCNLSNEEEQNEQQEFLVKLYRNQAVCYNKRELWKKTCLMCQELLRIGKTYKSYNAHEDCKALFQWGRALFGLGEYKRAREYLQKAQSIEPYNTDISSELLRLAAQEQQKVKADAEFARRAMGIMKITNEKKKEQENEVKEDEDKDDETFRNFQENICQTLIEFVEGPHKTITLPDGLTDLEIVQVKEMADDFGLFFKSRCARDKQTEYILSKD